MAAVKKKSTPGRVSRVKYDSLLQASLKQQAEIHQMGIENRKMSEALAHAQEENRVLKSEVSCRDGRISIGKTLLYEIKHENKCLKNLVASYRNVTIDISNSIEISSNEG